MPDRKPTNKLSIYLIKDEFDTPEKILDNVGELKSETIDGNTTLYYKQSGGYEPAWLSKFFGETRADKLKDHLFSAYVSAAMLIKVPVAGSPKIFAVTFGLGGWQLLNPGCYEERFGLMCTLNLVSPTTLRSIDKSNMGLAPKQAREQISQQGQIADFGIDIEQDLIKSVTGKCKEVSIGSTVTGKDSLHVSAKTDVTDIQVTLRKYHDAYVSDDYKTNFGWIDHIAAVKDPLTIGTLHELLDTKLADSTQDKLWLAIPEVVEWSDIEGFYYQGDRQGMHADLFMTDLRTSFTDQGFDLNVDNLKKYHAYSVSSSNGHVLHKWKLYNCLYAEITDPATEKFYILSNGKWYNIAKSFAEQVNAEYAAILENSITLPRFKLETENEEDYNLRAAAETGMLCLDKKLIQYGGGHSKIEFCDLFDAGNKTLIHVKKYGGSSVLSHLFNQGLVSGELMLSEAAFRDKVNSHLPSSAQFTNTSDKPIASDYRIVHGVISGSSKTLDIPFFSKVSLRNAKQRLELYGYTVSLQKIECE